MPSYQNSCWAFIKKVIHNINANVKVILFILFRVLNNYPLKYSWRFHQEILLQFTYKNKQKLTNNNDKSQKSNNFSQNHVSANTSYCCKIWAHECHYCKFPGLTFNNKNQLALIDSCHIKVDTKWWFEVFSCDILTNLQTEIIFFWKFFRFVL